MSKAKKVYLQLIIVVVFYVICSRTVSYTHLTQPIVGGVYRVSEKMLEQSGSEKYGNHATDVGLRIVNEFSKQGPQAFTVDPPTTDRCV